MTRAGRLLRNLLERLAGSYYEGPHPPATIAEAVVAFAAANPRATTGEWMEFTTRLAQGQYRRGYVRGLEWAERDLDALQLGDPERLVAQETADFEWHAPAHPTSEQLAMTVPQGLPGFLARLPDDLARAKALDMLGRYDGNFRVVVEVAKPPRHEKKR